jgi:hypothetical protein
MSKTSRKQKHAQLSSASSLVEDDTTPDLQPSLTGYNPNAADHGCPAKLWELLRRNPYFRASAFELSRLELDHSKNKDRLNLRLAETDKINPFAGFVMRWLFRPKYLNFYFPRQPHDFLKPMTESEFKEIGQWWLTEEWLFELETILNAEHKGDEYAGSLRVSGGEFNLNTPWPKTPELFRFLFRFLWDEYDLDRISSTLAARYTKYGEVYGRTLTIDWEFLNAEDRPIDLKSRNDLQQVKALLDRHKIFVIPKTVMTRAMQKKLEEQFSEMLSGMEGVNFQKLPSFLGSTKDWGIFDFCRAEIKYEIINLTSHQRLGFGRAKSKYMEYQRSNRKWLETSNWGTHITTGYGDMESYMFATFPAFNFQQLAIKLDVNSVENISNMSVLSLQGALEKLEFLTSKII